MLILYYTPAQSRLYPHWYKKNYNHLSGRKVSTFSTYTSMHLCDGILLIENLIQIINTDLVVNR